MSFKKIKDLKEFEKLGFVIEYDSWLGEYLAECREHKFEVSGDASDISRYLRGHASSRHGVKKWLL